MCIILKAVLFLASHDTIEIDKCQGSGIGHGRQQIEQSMKTDIMIKSYLRTGENTLTTDVIQSSSLEQRQVEPEADKVGNNTLLHEACSIRKYHTALK
jgi:hypothetical protein